MECHDIQFDKMCSYFGRMDKEFHNFEDAKQECLLDSRCIAIYDGKCDEIGKISIIDPDILNCPGSLTLDVLS